jgi:hypothetical protein
MFPPVVVPVLAAPASEAARLAAVAAAQIERLDRARTERTGGAHGRRFVGYDPRYVRARGVRRGRTGAPCGSKSWTSSA